PAPPLLAYTTLFRSFAAQADPGRTVGGDRTEPEPPALEDLEVELARRIGEHADRELAAQLALLALGVVAPLDRTAGVAQLRREHLAQQHRALGAAEVERLVAVLDRLVVGQLVGPEHRLRPGPDRLFE